MDLENHSPFPHMVFEKAGTANRIFDVLVVAGTFALVHGQPLPIAEEQRPINGADRYVGEPETTGFLEETQLVLGKRRTDVHVLGSARSPNGEPAARWPVAVRVGPVYKTAMVTGPRFWNWSVLRGWHLTEPRPVAEVPLHMGMAYGGRVPRRPNSEPAPDGDPHDPKRWDIYPANPAGMGYFGGARLDRAQFYPAAQMEDVEKPLRSIARNYQPVAFGPRPRWSPERARLVGTCDKRWQERDFPFLPADFDYGFYQSAQQDLIVPGWLEGDEPLVLLGCREAGELRSQLPALRILALLGNAKGHSQPETLRLDTVNIDLDRDVVQMVWRRAVPKEWGLRRVLLSAVPDGPPPMGAPRPVYLHRPLRRGATEAMRHG